MSIAVDPKYQGQQIGKSLVNAFFNETASRKVKHVNLTTDAKENDATNYFYQSLGFRLHRAYKTPENREMNEYLFDLSLSTKN
jgi:ribosomal protein S18 acetylase RimI-like enzyme